MELRLEVDLQPTMGSAWVRVSAWSEGKRVPWGYDGTLSETALVGALTSICGPEAVQQLVRSAGDRFALSSAGESVSVSEQREGFGGIA